MRPDNGQVDHLDAFADAFGLVQGFQQKVPQSGERPAPELSIDRRPFAEMFVQVAPLRPGAGDPENPIENKAMVLRPSPAMGAPEPSRMAQSRPIPHPTSIPKSSPPPCESNLKSEPRPDGNPICQRVLEEGCADCFHSIFRGSLRSLIRSIRAPGSKSGHSMRQISSWRIAVATAKRMIRPTGICCAGFASKAATSLSSSFCAGRLSRSFPFPTRPGRASAMRANAIGSVERTTPCTAAACDRIVLIYPRSMPRVTGPAPSRARAFPNWMMRSRSSSEIRKRPNLCSRRVRLAALDRPMRFPTSRRSSRCS